ncbi:Hypothetical protein PAS_chr1-4_0583 [Komagataella phaffii GS115]|uniref:Uncharacterized protein n=1 Tax=Komagataella phaffii (strain GS115 / ATCC 20864) TaxID=644223 RepID=C4QYW6_KOMPG|nr:Hypothetical protein PAS_chr1-4_0583 [Komagataella phaffii GS115]CAY68440.1 Hypothetical protein PAS_chr1-4_0583 [Komagataella phaffii GS115]
MWVAGHDLSMRLKYAVPFPKRIHYVMSACFLHDYSSLSCNNIRRKKRYGLEFDVFFLASSDHQSELCI